MIEDFIRTLEVLSVAPAFVKYSIEKYLYINSVKKSQTLEELTSKFMSSTEMLLGDKLTPGGYYTGVWCRDASYILNELLLMGKEQSVARWIEWIWQHQLKPSLRVVHGRGSPDNGFRMSVVNEEFFKRFSGSLPTSIQHNYCEVYAKSPDIDSTALMISATCKLLLSINNREFADRLIPHLRDAIGYLESRDSDGDGLVEQGPNEDWMDSMLRSGKTVYSQAVWAAALRDWCELSRKMKMYSEADMVEEKLRIVVSQVNAKLWRNDGYYADVLEPNGFDEGRPTITQDVSLFLLLQDAGNYRVTRTLDAIKKHLWKELGVACTLPSSKTGPCRLKPYDYQNGAFWPWTTSLEILARIRNGRLEESSDLLKKTLPYAALEWMNPYTRSSGAYPFRTGIAAMRTAVRRAQNIV